jgi:hypothetical protein
MYAELDLVGTMEAICNFIFLYFFPLMKKVTKKSRLILIYLNSTSYYTIVSRPFHCVALFGHLAVS